MQIKLTKTPATGMRDILPREMEIRNRALSIIREAYAPYGFLPLETPCVEHLENLNCKAGGENEKLTFKILKRGEKLKIDQAQTEEDLSDLGLRYDLTVPLVRFYAAHNAELPTPFKALQYGNVFRADRPQKGRFRQFMQYDIDILGEESNLAEVELILATSNALGKLGFKGFEIRLNDRRILKAMADYAGFQEAEQDEVFILLDKMDKIGQEGVRTELLSHGYSAEQADRFLSIYHLAADSENPVKTVFDTLGGTLNSDIKGEFESLLEMVNAVKGDFFNLVFDPTLVRGMSYYTGTIFEVSMKEYGGSVGGGGRYDGLVERFTGQKVPACGFSLGFERLIMILMEREAEASSQERKTAILLEKGLAPALMLEAMQEAEKIRAGGGHVLVARMMKNKKRQKEQLADQGYGEIREVYNHPIQ